METMLLGQITNAVGLKGELRVYPYTDYKEKFEELDYCIIEGLNYSIQNVRYMKGMVVLKLTGIEDRTTAESYKGKDLLLYRKDAPPLPADTYYIKDLIGLRVVDETGIEIGRVKDVIQHTAQDLYEVETMQGDEVFLVPAVEEFIKSIDLEEGVIRMHLIEGLMES
jgi:16S rRNA processing protein RimM